MSDIVFAKLRNFACTNLFIGLGTILLTLYFTFMTDSAGEIPRYIVYTGAVLVLLSTWKAIFDLGKSIRSEGLSKVAGVNNLPTNNPDLTRGLVWFSIAEGGLLFVLISLLIGMFSTETIPTNALSWGLVAAFILTLLTLVLRVVIPLIQGLQK